MKQTLQTHDSLLSAAASNVVAACVVYELLNTLSVSNVISYATMASLDDNDRSTLSNNNVLIPVSSDKVPLEWDGNDAT